MNLIVNADKNWGIGKNNELLVHIPNDMRCFRQDGQQEKLLSWEEKH